MGTNLAPLEALVGPLDVFDEEDEGMWMTRRRVALPVFEGHACALIFKGIDDASLKDIAAGTKWILSAKSKVLHAATPHVVAYRDRMISLHREYAAEAMKRTAKAAAKKATAKKATAKQTATATKATATKKVVATPEPQPKAPSEDVWADVRLGDELYVSRRKKGDAEDGVYFSLESNCTWEGEHGLQIVLRANAGVTKIGQFNGHVTNSDAYADRSLAGVIYKR